MTSEIVPREHVEIPNPPSRGQNIRSEANSRELFFSGSKILNNNIAHSNAEIISALEKAGINQLEVGQAVTYELAEQRGKQSATEIKTI